MQLLPLSLFVMNIALTIADAAVAYHTLPRFMAALNADPEAAGAAESNARSLLPLLVALYTALDCYAYAERQPLYLAGVTALLLIDIGTQLFISRRVRRRS